MNLAVLFATSFMVGLSGAMTPGPLLTVTIGESSRRGFIAGPLIVLGHGLLEGVLVAALALGLGVLLAIPVVVRVIAVAGGLFLIYMGWGMSQDAWKGRVELVASGLYGENSAGDGNTEGNVQLGSDRLHPVLSGVLVSLSNPYWSLWWATIGLSYITTSLKQGLLGLVSFFSGHIFSDLFWYCLVAAAVAGSRRFLHPSVYRGIMVACGLFLIGLGLYFVFSGLVR